MIALYVHPKNSNHLRSHLRAIIALDHSRLGLKTNYWNLMHQSIPPAPSAAPPPPASSGPLRGICPPCQPRGWGICEFCTARGLGICHPRSHSQAFDTHAVSYQNITTQKVLLEKKQIGSPFKHRNKLKRVVKASGPARGVVGYQYTHYFAPKITIYLKIVKCVIINT